MQTSQYRNRHTLIDRVDAKRRKVRNKVKLSVHECLVHSLRRDRYVANISETLSTQKFFSDISRSVAYTT